MADEKSQTLELMANPLNLQTKLIDHLEAKLLGGQAVLVDPNSVAMHLIEGFSEVAADYAFATQRALERRLPTRAQSMKDLYLHMSDYDYVGRFATPSVAKLELGIDKDYIISRGVLMNNSYRVVHIPADTEFTLGNLKFSLYYPIQIQVDERTKVPLATYDLSKQHPLRPMSSNRLALAEYKYLNYNLIMLEILLYQFERTTREETLDPMIGFTETYNFTDQFYAVRLFTDYRGNRIELAQSMVQDNYDASVPTARVAVMSDTNKFTVNIPQTYFASKMMGHKLYIELFTTKGDIAANVGSLPPDQVLVDFKLDKKSSNPFTDCMKFNPTLFCRVTSPTTTEGTNGYDYETMRARVIRDSYKTKVQITPIDVQNYYADYGIKVQRYEDNLTNLIYFVYKPFINENGQIEPSTNTYLSIKPDTPTKVSSIKDNPDGSLTILPTTWFKYKPHQDLAIPVTDEELKYISEMDKPTLAREFNEGSYIRTPFHIRLIKNDFYPTASSYNLMQPTITNCIVTEDNPNALAQMLIVSETITHEQDGQGGFSIKFIIKKDYLKDVPEEKQYVYMYTRSTDGLYIGAMATKIADVDDFEAYEIKLGTNYWINEKDEINITTFKDGDTNLNYKVPLESQYDVVFMCDSSYFPDVNTEQHMYKGVPTSIAAEKTVLLRQSMKIHLGHNLDDVVMNLVNPAWERARYRRYNTDIPHVYSENILECDNKGVPIVEVVDGVKKLKIKHHKGEQIIGDDGQPEWLHKKGELWLDTNGQPTMLNNRINEYQIQAAVFDGKLFVSEHPLQKNFVANLVAMFETNFKIIREARGYVTERTAVYFKPAKTMGTAVFQTGNGVRMTMGLDLKLSFRFHCEPIVNTDDEIKEATRVATIKIVEPMLQNEIISQTDMANMIRKDVFYVEAVDSLGINDHRDLQTLSVVESSSQPSIRKKLVISDDNLIVLLEDLLIVYVDVR